MKQLKTIFTLIITIVVLLATTVGVSAIDFDAEQKYESVFVIYSGNALGSGFAIGQDCIITNAHVIEDTTDVTIKTYSGEQYKAVVTGMDTDQDIAVLYVEDVKFEYLSVCDSKNIATGDDVYAIGAPKSMEYTLTKGVVSAKSREVGNYSYIQIDAPINEGNSGGPLLNATGEVIGVNTLKMTDSEGIGLAIPITNVCEYLKTLEITLDNNGNVSGSISSNSQPTQPQPTEAESSIETPPKKTYKSEAMIAVAVAFISIVFNVIFIIMLCKKRRGTIYKTVDPSERTDFEIDILE